MRRSRARAPSRRRRRRKPKRLDDLVGWAKRSVPAVRTSRWARFALPTLRADPRQLIPEVDMRIVVHGQQAFGKAVLEALLKRGDDVVAVYVAPEKPGQKADPLKEAALAAKLPVYQPASYRKPDVWEEFRALKPDLQVMAFVTLFVPEEFLNIPTHGSIQYHPSLLPKYRGPSAINWPII